MKLEIRKRDQQLTRWRSENAVLRKKLQSAEARLGHQGHTKVFHAPAVERETMVFHVSSDGNTVFQEHASSEHITNSMHREQVV